MEAKAIDQIRAELLDVLAELPISQQEEVLDFALFLRGKAQAHRQKLAQSGTIADQAVGLLKAEFAAEDAALTESVMPDLVMLESVEQGS